MRRRQALQNDCNACFFTFFAKKISLSNPKNWSIINRKWWKVVESATKTQKSGRLVSKVANWFGGDVSMFMGEYNHTIDAKGRLIIPSKFRDALGNEFVVTKGLEGCLFVFEKYEFDSFIDKLNEKSDLEAKVRKIKRFFISGAQEAEVDKQGRILVPSVLRDHAALEKDVVFAGVGGHIEIWAKNKWDEISAYDDINDIAEELSSFGISF